MDKSSSPSCSSCGPWWRLPLLLAVLLAAILLMVTRGMREATQPVTAPRGGPAAHDARTVSLTIDYGDGRRQQLSNRWYDGMTVYDLLRETPRDDFRLEVHGSGTSAFLADLDGVSNEGPGGRNWTFRVNGQLADRSFAVYELQHGDEVLWTSAPQQ